MENLDKYKNPEKYGLQHWKKQTKGFLGTLGAFFFVAAAIAIYVGIVILPFYVIAHFLCKYW